METEIERREPEPVSDVGPRSPLLPGDDGNAPDQPLADPAPGARDDPAGDLAPGARDDPAGDPAWRLSAWLLPLGAGVSACLTFGQTAGGGIAAPVGYTVAAALALLAALLLRDARRRARHGCWVRYEVHEYAWPAALGLAVMALVVRGADPSTYLPALAALLPVVWGLAMAPHVERVRRLLPHPLPVLNATATRGDEKEADEIDEIVRAVLNRLPDEIAVQLCAWDVEVQEEMRPAPRDEVVFGCCFTAAHVIAIYRRPHLRYYRRGEPLRRAVTYTVLHELAHALGLGEDGVRRLGWLSDDHTLPA